MIDVRHLLDLRWAAIRRPRVAGVAVRGVADGSAESFLATDHLCRVDPPWTGGPLETDIVAHRTPKTTSHSVNRRRNLEGRSSARRYRSAAIIASATKRPNRCGVQPRRRTRSS